MGRPRKPIEQHIADGTFRPDRHAAWLREAAERPALARGDRPRMPRGLSSSQRTAWNEIVAALEAVGVLDRRDAGLIEAMAVNLGHAREARALALKNPAAAAACRQIELQSWRLYLAIARDFGLAGVKSRERLGLPSGSSPPPPVAPASGEELGESPRARSLRLVGGGGE